MVDSLAEEDRLVEDRLVRDMEGILEEDSLGVDIVVVDSPLE